MDFCCKFLKNRIETKDSHIIYIPIFREIGVRTANASSSLFTMRYCPWCNSKLPRSLRDEYFETLEKEYGIDDPFDEDINKVPQEFKTDEWWKNRNIDNLTGSSEFGRRLIF